MLLKPPVKCKDSPFSNGRARTKFVESVGATATSGLTAKEISQNQYELASFLALLHQFLTDSEAVDILRQFRGCGRWESNRQVLWTGMNQETVQIWADEHGLITLTTALGRLKDLTHPACLRRVKSDKAWSKYMKGASALFALCIAQEEHGSVLLVTPPPGERFHPRGGTSFQLIEAPILAGLWGPSYLERINMVHPHVDLAKDYQYQFWPQDEVGGWTDMFEHCPHDKVVWRAVKRLSPSPPFSSQNGGFPGWEVVRPSKDARLEQSRRDKQKHQERMQQLELEQQAIKMERLAQSARDKKRHQERMLQLELEQQAIKRERLAQSARDKKRHQERMAELARQAEERERMEQSRKDRARNEAQRQQKELQWLTKQEEETRFQAKAVKKRKEEDEQVAKVVTLLCELALAIRANESEKRRR